jgi:2-acylglycerol O-acyltransferase 2
MIKSFISIINFIFSLSCDNIREFLGLAIYSVVALSPILFLILCFIIYLSFSVFVLLCILVVYLGTYLPGISADDKLWRWCQVSNFWTWLREGVNGKILIDNEKHLSNSKKYMFAFHPHGAFPFTLAWLFNSSEFLSYYQINKEDIRERLKDIHVLMASLAFTLPFMREICIGLGGKAITKEIFAETLQADKHVLICPGGVSEMYLTPEIHTNTTNNLTILTKHKGFIKYAIRYGRPLVPVLSFGEQELFTVTRCFSNIEDWLKTHINNQITLPWFSGRYGLPIPRDIPITCVVGKPMKVKQMDNPTDEAINKCHKQFYSKLAKMFYKYKDHPDVGVRYNDIKFVNN